tara:strand:+ start:121 stop:522 length:402 start_codon:yes stop_codon:yes gene_type:complete
MTLLYQKTYSQLNSKNDNFSFSIDKSNSRNTIVTRNIVYDFYIYLSDLFSKKIAKRISLKAMDVFQYFHDYKMEEVLLLINENKLEINFKFKVCPSYLDSYQNLNAIEKYLKDNTLIISLKDFYKSNIKKYYN